MGSLDKNGVLISKQLNDIEYIAFTWSPKRNTISPKYGLTDDIDKHFRKWIHCMNYIEVYPELNLNGNLHYHAIISIKDKIKWYKSILPSLKHEGFVYIKSIDDLFKWKQYCDKEKQSMEKICEQSLPITLSYLKSYTKLKRKLQLYKYSDVVEPIKSVSESILDYV